MRRKKKKKKKEKNSRCLERFLSSLVPGNLKEKKNEKMKMKMKKMWKRQDPYDSYVTLKGPGGTRAVNPTTPDFQGSKLQSQLSSLHRLCSRRRSWVSTVFISSSFTRMESLKVRGWGLMLLSVRKPHQRMNLMNTSFESMW